MLYTKGRRIDFLLYFRRRCTMEDPDSKHVCLKSVIENRLFTTGSEGNTKWDMWKHQIHKPFEIEKIRGELWHCSYVAMMVAEKRDDRRSCSQTIYITQPSLHQIHSGWKRAGVSRHRAKVVNTHIRGRQFLALQTGD